MVETVALIQKTPDCVAVDWALKQHVSIYLPDKIALMVCSLRVRHQHVKVRIFYLPVALVQRGQIRSYLCSVSSAPNTPRLEPSTFQWL